MIPLNNFINRLSHQKAGPHDNEKVLFECQPHHNYKLYLLMILMLYSSIGFFIIYYLSNYTDMVPDDSVFFMMTFMAVFIYVTYEYVAETVKISHCRYRLTTHYCYIASRYLVNNMVSIPYNKIVRVEVLRRPWQQWFGLTTIRLIEKNVSQNENWDSEVNHFYLSLVGEGKK